MHYAKKRFLNRQIASDIGVPLGTAGDIRTTDPGHDHEQLELDLVVGGVITDEDLAAAAALLDERNLEFDTM